MLGGIAAKEIQPLQPSQSRFSVCGSRQLPRLPCSRFLDDQLSDHSGYSDTLRRAPCSPR
eukprot:c37699_g1_i1 orf=87-266(+)